MLDSLCMQCFLSYCTRKHTHNIYAHTHIYIYIYISYIHTHLVCIYTCMNTTHVMYLTPFLYWICSDSEFISSSASSLHGVFGGHGTLTLKSLLLFKPLSYFNYLVTTVRDGGVTTWTFLSTVILFIVYLPIPIMTIDVNDRH